MLAKAILAVDRKKVEIGEVELGPMGEWDIRVELEASAISAGTESYALAAHTKENSPYIVGYAPVGRVVETGEKAAASFNVGERVSYFAPSPPVGVRQGCGGHMSPAICHVDPETRDLLGPDQYVVKVPEGLSSARAAFGGVSAVSCMGVSLAEPNVGDKAFVIGQGLIGHFAALHFKLRGAEVAVADIHENRLRMAKEGGMDHTIDCAKEDMAEAVRSIWPDGADIIADSTGNYDVIDASVDAIRYRGKYVILAWCKGANFNLPKFHNRVSAAYFPWTLEGARVLHSWRLMDMGALDVDHIISHRMPYTDAQKAFDMIYNTPGQMTGILLEWK